MIFGGPAILGTKIEIIPIPTTIQAGLLDRVILLLKRIDMGDIIPPQELAKLNAEYARLLTQMDSVTFDALVEYEANILEAYQKYKGVRADIHLGFNVR